MSDTLSRTLRICAVATALLFVGGAQAGSPENYLSNQAFSAAAGCLQRISRDCTPLFDQYVDAAERALRSERHPQPGQELRLRAAQRRLQTTIAVLNADAAQTVTLEPQAIAQSLQRIVQRIDALLGHSARPDGILIAPAAPADQVQVVELLPAPAAPHTEALTLWAETSTSGTAAESSAVEMLLSQPRP